MRASHRAPGTRESERISVNLAELTPEQERQIERQCRAHRHARYLVDLKLSYGEALRDFAVDRAVMRPELMTSVIFARCLHFANGFYLDRKCLDMGCGTGIQGIVMALRGARHVVLSDVSPAAVRNTAKNIRNFELGGHARVVQGDLFQRIDGDYDVIVFNHPFFVGRPSSDLRKKLETTLAAGAFINDSLEDPDLIHRFLREARRFLRKGGTILMPYYELAGAANNPALQGPRHGFKVLEHFRGRVATGLQRGVISVYQLR